MGGARLAPTACLALMLLATPVSLGAQPPTPAAVPDQGTTTGSISGRLADAVTGSAISGGMLVLRELTSRDQYVVTTETDGSFTLIDLPAAGYTLHASALGYVGRQYGQRHALETGEAIALSTGETRSGIDIALIPGGVIAGQVTTENGQPLPLAEVEALRPQLENNLRVLIPVGRAESDQNGRFRISGLPPGHYYVAAIDPADEGTEDIAGQVHWDQTFFPGVQNAAEAERIRLGSGNTITDIDFPMLGVTRVNVLGQLFNPDEGELATGSIIMSPESDDGLGVGMAHAGIVRPNGTFEFRNVSPGSYRLRASARTVQPGPALFASFLLSVGERDVPNAVLFLNPGASLFGSVEVADGADSEPPLMTDLWVSAPMADGSMGSGLTRSQVFEDGTFSLATPDGARVIRLEGIPAPWSLEAVYFQGRDIIDVPFDLRSGDERERLRVVLTDRASRLTGVLQDDEGNPITDRTIVALPVNSNFWHPGSRHVALTYPDRTGRYEIRGLPAGVYLVSAVTGIHGGDLYDHAMFQEIAGSAAEAIIEAGETTTLDLVLSESGVRLVN